MYWDDLAVAAKTVGITIILNPSSGPGTNVDPNYVSAIQKVREAGGKVIGYVHTSYGKRELTDITEEIEKYVTFYDVDGFFIDQMTSENIDENVAYYKSIYDYIKKMGAKYSLTGNPGTMPDEIYLSHPLVDNMVVFEGSESGYENFLPAGWQASYPKHRFAHLVYDANSNQMQRVFKSSSNNIVGHLYVSDKPHHPYDALPEYWELEVQAAAGT